jgi:hypothetical protein
MPALTAKTRRYGYVAKDYTIERWKIAPRNSDSSHLLPASRLTALLAIAVRVMIEIAD